MASKQPEFKLGAQGPAKFNISFVITINFLE